MRFPLLTHRRRQKSTRMHKKGQGCVPKDSPAAVDAAPSVIALCAFGAAELVPNVVAAGARARECVSVWACNGACVCMCVPTFA